MKNLLLIHLESLSQMAFWQYAPEMPVLFRLMQKSLSFSRFYAASTSSVMSMSDLLHGDSSELDHLAVFPRSRGLLRGKAANLMRVLHDAGYASYGVQYGSFCLGDAPNSFWGVWPEICGSFRQPPNREEMHRELRDFLEKTRAAGQPFALYFWNMNTHLRDDDPLEPPAQAYHERFQSGSRLLDRSVKRLLEELENLDLLKDTLILAVGDHGDDLFRHGLYRGRSHIIDPYATVCWCPAFLHGGGIKPGLSRRLVSMVDWQPTLLRILFPERPPERLATPFSGGDIFTTKRSLAFSQSMFALQLERSDPGKAISKSYAVTDGDYRLMVSSPVLPEDSGGLEFFAEQCDYDNSRNLLDHCRLDAEGSIAAFEPEFLADPDRSARLRQIYLGLKEALRSFIRQKESVALEHGAGEGGQLFTEELFRRNRVWEGRQRQRGYADL